MRRAWWYVGLCFIFLSCRKETEVPVTTNPGALPAGFPEIEYPEDNLPSASRIELGRLLFHDTRLSDDNLISCASCHLQEFAFASNASTNAGSDGAEGTRNVPSLANIAYHPYFTREGGVPSLEMQVLVPVQEHNEFNTNILLIVEELQDDELYRALSLEAYGQEISAFVITRALANFERTLISGNTPYDQFVAGMETALSEEEKAGMDLFFSERTQCASCHSGFNFSTYEILNNGLYAEYADPGLWRLTGEEGDKGKFKVASLRNVGLTAPYMHDGSLQSLYEVVDHYAAGGAGHSNQDERIAGFELSPEERENLVRFLHTLSDYEFISQ